jgi:hypothetical protein
MRLFNVILNIINIAVVVFTACNIYLIRKLHHPTINPIPYYSRSNSSAETRKKVAIIDTGYDLSEEKLKPYACSEGSYDFTGKGIQDTHGHGTNIAWNVMKGLDPNKFCFVMLKFYSEFSWDNLERECAALSVALKQHVVLLNASLNGNNPSLTETSLINKILRDGTVVVVSAGNDSIDLGARCVSFPACSIKDPNFHVAGALYQDGRRANSSNYGDPVTDWALGIGVAGPKGTWHDTMSGTSQAAANVSNRLLKEMR